MNFILENSGFHHFIVSSRDFYVRTHKFLLELGFRKEESILVFIISQFLYFFPIRCQKQRERKEGKKNLI